MRRFKLRVQTSVDGFMAVPEGEPGWPSVQFTDDVYAYMDALMASVDAIVLGRKIADEFITAWASGPSDEPETLVDWINNAHKVVISRSLTGSQWDNVEVARGDIVESVSKLKAQPGGDLIAYGGVGLVSTLVTNDLLDDLYLFVNPVAIGDGRPVFGDLNTHRRFRLVNAQPFDDRRTPLPTERILSPRVRRVRRRTGERSRMPGTSAVSRAGEQLHIPFG